MKKRWFLAVPVLIAGYLYSGLPLPSSHTNDPRLAHVFAREGLGFTNCVGYSKWRRSDLMIPLEVDPQGPPNQFTLQRFKDSRIQRVSDKFASGDFEIVMPKVHDIEVKGRDYEPGCASDISPIIVADDVSIVYFSAPGGAIGYHAFHRGFFGWRAIERVQWGWW